MNVTDEQLDALLDADEQSNPDNRLELFARIHERRRRRAHAKAKEAQPAMLLRHEPCHGDVLDQLRAFVRAPLTEQDVDAGTGAMDYLLLTVMDTLEAGEAEDAIFAMARVVRKAWAWNARHLGPIEAQQKKG